MKTPPAKHGSVVAILVLLAGIGSFPVVAEEPEIVIEQAGQTPGMIGIISRILDDPQRDYASVWGPDDCNSETLFLATKEQLRGYVVNPVENQEALRAYILSGKEPCNCTRALIGKDFDILIEDLETDFSHLPCF
jgi:hypothetical protein